jgi:TonB-dependent starch-binding outer membrane protein SusC
MLNCSRFASVVLLISCLTVGAVGHAQLPGDSASPSLQAGRSVRAVPSPFASRIPAGASVYVLDSTDLASSAGENLSTVLQARVPGLSVLRPDGSAAAGSRVRLRGPHSLLMTTEPIVIVDGIRVNAMQESSVIDTGIRTSRLDDIMPEDIARLEVLAGPAAAALFGPGASAGALVITTKRGSAGPLRWSSRAELRSGGRPTGFPANYHRTGVATLTGEPTSACDLVLVASGACMPTGLDVWNPLEQVSPFRSQQGGVASASVAGGFGQTSGRISGTGRRTLGVREGDDAGRLGVRAKVEHRFSRPIDIVVHGGYTRTSTGLTESGSAGGVLTSGLFGAATDDDTLHGYLSPDYPHATRQRASHWESGAAITWRARSWLAATAAYGRDQLGQRDHYLDSFAFPSSGVTGYDRWATLTHATTTTRATLTASYPLSQRWAIGGQTALAYERLGSRFTISDSSQTSPPGFGSSQRWARSDWIFSSPSLRQQLAWRDQVFVGGALRWERRKGLGAKMPSAWFKTADASWSLGDIGWMHELRLRAAYGEAGGWMAGNPGAFASDNAVFNTPSAAPPTERTAESEVGVDGGIGHWVTLAFTAFRADVSKLYYVGPGGPSAGFPGIPGSPDGEMRNEGVELSAKARLLDLGGLRWDAMLSAATLRNRVRYLGGFPIFGGSIVRTRPGYPAAGYWTRQYTYGDANHDGIIGVDEVHFLADTAVFVGASLPTREVALRSELSLPGGLSAGVHLDYRGGHKLSNTNERLRCSAFRNCRAAQDPTAPLEDQAKVAAISSRELLSNPFIENASFLKLRELSLTWNVPARLSKSVGAPSAAGTLAGRNLATWTRYKGLDPELDFRRFDDTPRNEFGMMPLIREIVVRLDVGGGARK